MAQTKTSSATSTSEKKTAAEMREWYEKNKTNIENFAKSQSEIHNLRDVTKPTTRTISTINKEELKSYIENIGASEKQLRTVARYLYYRSNVFYRLVNWYADMWDLRCRKVTPKYDFTKDQKPDSIKSNYYKTLELLERMDLQGNCIEALINVYIQDVYYGIRYLDDTGMFLYSLDPDECMIDSRYSTKNFGFAVDMSKWKSAQRQKIIEYLGSPLKEMYSEYERTKEKWIHMPDEYCFCLKFRTDIWDTAIPPFLPIFLSLANLEDLVDIQAEADALSIYKLIYLPLNVHSNSKDVDDFEIDPALAKKYFEKLSDDAIPDNVGAAIIPGKELKTIDFSNSADSDTTSVEKASNQVLQTAGGGAVINSSNITSTAAFNAWLKEETEFAISTLMPQINGLANMIAFQELGKNACYIDHFEVSVYTKEDLAKQLLESCQYGYNNKIAYNTLLGISERETIAQAYLEEEVLGLHDIMRYPLSSSFTSSGNSNTEDGYTTEVGQGAPTKDAGDLNEENGRMK